MSIEIKLEILKNCILNTSKNRLNGLTRVIRMFSIIKHFPKYGTCALFIIIHNPPMLIRISIKAVCLLATVFFTLSSSATNYYLSNNGSDTNNGTSNTTAWKTLEKLNMVTFNAGDSILFKRGDTFYGSLIVKSSGNAINSITYSAYGTGVNPIITGFTNVTSWTNKGGNIWESTNAVSTKNYTNVVTINNKLIAMGRFPNSGWRTVQSITNSSITDNSLPATDWNGAELVTRKEHYIIARDSIISQSGNTLNFIGSYYSPKVGWGYFIQNDLKTLDTQNEWYYNPLTKKLSIYSIAEPKNVNIATIDTLVKMLYKNFISFNGITFTGANREAFNLGSCAYLKIQNCNFNLNYSGIFSDNFGNSSDSAIIKDCIFNNTQNTALTLTNEFTNATIINNLFEHTALLTGMSGSGDHQGFALIFEGAGSIAQYNSIKNTGYIGIAFRGSNTSVKNNYVDSSCLIKDDGGGIYILKDLTSGFKNIESNIVTNTIGNRNGMPAAPQSSNNAQGIYSDGESTNVRIINNSVANSGYAGIFANAGNNVTIAGNTIFNNLMSGIQINDDGPIPVTGLIVKNNMIVQKYLPIIDLYGSRHFTQLALTAVTHKNNISTWGIIDSNYYARPMDDNLIINIQPNGGTNTPGSYLIKTLPGWANVSSFDANSKKSPKSITDVNDLRFEFNATIYNKTIFLDASYMDIKSEIYNGNITLEPFSSAILIKSGSLGTLPLTWLGVQAQWTNSGEAKVSWKVSQQQNVKNYTVQYSSDGKYFTNVCSVISSAITSYNCIVAAYNNSKNYYRVMQTDIDGKTTYSKIVLLQTPKKSALSVYPNPANSIIYIAGLADFSEAVIIDSGSKIINRFITVSNTQCIDISELAKGIYFFKLSSVNDTQTIKFMKE